MSKFYYESDDLGYEIENVGANHHLSPQKNSSSHSFTEPDSMQVMYSCDPPTVTPVTGVTGVYNVDPDGAGAQASVRGRLGRDGLVHYRVGTENWVIGTDGSSPHAVGAGGGTGGTSSAVDSSNPPRNAPAAPAGFHIVNGGRSVRSTAPAGWTYYYANNTRGGTPAFKSVTVTDGANGGTVGSATDVATLPADVNANRPARTPGASNPNAVAAAPTGTPEMGPNETRLREALRGRGLQDGEIDAFMARFPADGPGRAHTTRENQVADYLPPTRGSDRRNDAHKPETMSAADLRTNIRQSLRDQARTNMMNARPPMTAQQYYDYLDSHGLLNDPNHSHRPSDSTTALTRSTGNDWPLRETTAQESRELAHDPIFTSSPGTLTRDGVTADIQRHRYVDEARRRYVEWARSARDATPPGLGLSESDANARFNERAEQLQLMRRNPDASYSVRNDWNPNDTRPDSPAQSFFRNPSGGALQFDGPNGTLRPDNAATFRHENPVTAEPSNPVDHVARQAYSVQASRHAYYASLTGQDPDGTGPFRVVEEDGKHYLVSPDPNHRGQETRQEIRVMGPPPLTRDEALAVMQAQNLTDQDGRPLPNVTADNFTSRLGQVQTGEFGRNQALGQARDWEREQIAGVLSRDPYNKSPQEITRFLHSQHFLGEDADVGQMERFRREAAGATRGSTEARGISDRVTRADVPANEPRPGSTEGDRAADIRDTLSTARRSAEDRNAAEARAGRSTTRNEGDRNRANAREIEQMRIDSTEREGRRTRESNRQIERERQDREDTRQRLRLEHESAEKEKDRQLQNAQMLIQFLGTMISAMMQAMGTAHQANMQALAGVNQATFSRFSNRG